MKYYLKNQFGLYKSITEKTYNEVFKIDASLLMVSIKNDFIVKDEMKGGLKE